MSIALVGIPSVNTVVLQDPWRKRWMRYERPVRILTAFDLDEVLPLIDAAEAAVNREGLTAAGFVAYEAAAACDGALVTHRSGGFPLAWFGLYAEGEAMDAPGAETTMHTSIDWQPSLSADAYRAAIGRVRDYIAAGDTYQVNYSFRLRADAPAAPWDLFCRMVTGTSAGYAAYIDTGDWVVCSASPELFFRLNGRDIVSRPMKGTRPRGRWKDEDAALAGELQHSPKDRAENVMIVDMVRNDLGRICEPGSVNVAHLFDVERYPTVLQMTSTVHGQTDAGMAAIFRALFPAASITGAPKARTMEIIAELEGAPRRIYTGSIGYMAPDREAQFNVAIRSVLIDRESMRAEYGVGGGVVWDSTETGEWAECQTKSVVLNAPLPPFELLESLLWMPQTGYLLPEKHAARLKASAEYFGWDLDSSNVQKALDAEADGLEDHPYKVRLTVSRDGRIAVTSAPLQPLSDPWRVRLARDPVCTDDPFLFHKTTCRTVYEDAKRQHPDVDDVLLWNPDGELTESTIANVVVEIDGRLVTPPIRCGLLAGVYRAFLLECGAIEESVVHKTDLLRCTRLCLINSVRGMWDVVLEDQVSLCHG